MITYKLDYTYGGSRPGYYILRYYDYDKEVGVDTIGILYDPHVAHAVIDFLNGVNNKKDDV